MQKQLKRKIIVWGAGGHARVVADVLKSNDFEIAGFIDDINAERRGELFCGAKVFANLDECRTEEIRDAFIAIGENPARASKAGLALKEGYRLVSLVHPRAIVAEGVILGPGTVVMAGAVLQPGSVVGSNVIINTLSSVDHECLLADNVHICPGARLAGKVRVDQFATVGIGATVIDKIRIGEGALVAAGAVVIQNVPANVVVAGVPAARLERESGPAR
jgi:UDP-N-acetylbacillosamine N-acetyltransferase